MPTRRMFRCPGCQHIEEQQGSLTEVVYPSCPSCQQQMVSYFGGTIGSDVLINYGYRESRYQSVEAANIAKFQFDNL